MSLIFFNNVITIDAPGHDMEGIYRILAISEDASMVALVQIPLAAHPKKSSRKLLPKVSEIIRIPLAVLNSYEQSEAIRQVELCNSPEMLIGSDDGDAAGRTLYARRTEIMAPFLEYENLSWALFCSKGLGHMVREAKSKFSCSRTTVYKLFSLLCLHGFLPSSLHPRFDRCGAPGITRPCDGTRLKAGRKTGRERVGGHEHNPQRGVTSEDRAKIATLYKVLKRPEVSDVKVYDEIVGRLYVNSYQMTPKGLVPELEQGTFPNYRQFKHIVQTEFKRLDRLSFKTTQGHFNRNMRGLKGKSWQGVAGPGHKYAIDSTIADIFLVSSVNRAWVCGRPIVYIVVDVWSTAIVGFFVCWSGPSWDMAKVALFCSSAGSELISNLWGFDDYLWLDPQPTLPARFLADRGEYLSMGSRNTSMALNYSFEINPSYRPDLKGLVEVLNRIAKDMQYGFVPGAIDARRKEMELHGKGKFEAILTLHEYAHYLTIIFNNYNQSADRSYRLDAEMIAAGVTATPAGLWAWGHQVGYGYRRFTDQSSLIRHLLPQGEASITRGGVRFSGLDYESPVIEQEGWTTYARNYGAMELPIHYFPGSTSRIWTPGSSGLTQFTLSPLAKAKPDICFDEWLDAYAYSRLQRPDREFRKVYESLVARQKANQIVESGREATNAAKSIYSGPQPYLSDVRSLEKKILTTESEVPSNFPSHSVNQGAEAHSDLIRLLFSAANLGDQHGD
jgi:putative transposase